MPQQAIGPAPHERLPRLDGDVDGEEARERVHRPPAQQQARDHHGHAGDDEARIARGELAVVAHGEPRRQREAGEDDDDEEVERAAVAGLARVAGTATPDPQLADRPDDAQRDEGVGERHGAACRQRALIAIAGRPPLPRRRLASASSDALP